MSSSAEYMREYRKQPQAKKYLKAYNGSPKQKNTQKKYNKSEKGKVTNANRQLLRYYGISLDDKKNMYIDQNGICDCCKKPLPGIDHKNTVVETTIRQAR